MEISSRVQSCMTSIQSGRMQTCRENGLVFTYLTGPESDCRCMAMSYGSNSSSWVVHRRFSDALSLSESTNWTYTMPTRRAECLPAVHDGSSSAKIGQSLLVLLVLFPILLSELVETCTNESCRRRCSRMSSGRLWAVKELRRNPYPTEKGFQKC